MSSGDSSPDLSELVRACAQQGDAQLWEEFVARTQRLIGNVVMRVAACWGETSPAVIDELVQDTYLKLCADQARILRDFQATHPNAIFGFLKVVTTNLVRDYFKSRRGEKRLEPVSGLTQAEVVTAGDTGASADEMGRRILLDEVDECLKQHVPAAEQARARLVFWLYYRHGFTARAIASLPHLGLSTKGVESMIHRLTRLVRYQLAQNRSHRSQTTDKSKGFRVAESF